MRSSGYGQIADSVRAERAVRITARFSDLRPFCPIIRASGLLVWLTCRSDQFTTLLKWYTVPRLRPRLPGHERVGG